MQLPTSIQEGKSLLEALRLSEAREHFTALTKANEGDTLAWVWLGRASLMEGDAEGSRKALEAALVLEPEQAEAIALLGLHALQKGDREGAIARFERATSLTPDLAMAHSNLATCYRESQQLAQAEASIVQALSIEPEEARHHFEHTLVLALQERVEESIYAGIRTLECNPLHINARLFLCEIYDSSGRRELAMRLLQEGLEHNPAAFPLKARLVRLFLVNQQPKEAHKEASELAETRGEYGDLIQLGQIELLNGLFEEAEVTFRRATEQAPDRWEGFHNLGEIYMAANLLGEAETMYRQAVERTNDDGRPLNALGLALLHQGKNDDAFEALTQSLERQPNQPETLFNMALCSVQRGDKETARQCTRLVLQLLPEQAQLHQEAIRLQRELDNL